MTRMTKKVDTKKGDDKKDKNGKEIMVAVKPQINCIPCSYEKFMSFSIGNMKFIDSYQLTGSALGELAKSLYNKQGKFNNFHFVQQEYHNRYELLCKKGLYPYEWFDDFANVDYRGNTSNERWL